MTRRLLSNYRILVVEDEYLLAEDIRNELENSGAIVVGPAAGLTQALGVIEDAPILDAAILDLNLRGEMAFPAAEMLRARNVPFLFVSGYDAINFPPCFVNTPFCAKPVTARQVTSTLAQIIPHT